MVTTTSLLIPLLALLSNLDATIASPPLSEYAPTCPQISADPIPVQQIPSHFPPRAVIDVSATETIKRTLATYALAVDGKDWAALGAVFAADAVANYSAPLGVLTGLSAIRSTLSASLAQFAGTQHSLGTQIVDVCASGVAVSLTYYTATHYLQGAARNSTSIVNGGQVLYAHGQYQDTWSKQQDGSWKIVIRNLVYMVSGLENGQ
ncbi:ethyl tert-butyl ether degradation protein [Diplodia corticola]|uniref:Ethyl tert-butyl ether degradation protein n=1 Tax=Diplodia corticola TaxID=236234 RepID=A0A1J9QWT2_9PEZI|nr:ethyl tert-butyl ether degradation protein [Diplodia corticola]OJD32849.1 ethyl tert-butyl ether degradation protein [Diplodia corticola]